MEHPGVPVNVGLRVKHARELLELTQEQVSTAMSFNDRQTLSDIENGKRAVKADELARFAEVLDQELEFFLDPFSVVAEAQYSWRASADVQDDVLDSFETRAGGWVGMLRWLRAQSSAGQSPLRFALRLDTTCTYEQAQATAEQLVRQFDLGSVPALRLVECIEQKLDIPVLFIDVPRDLPRGAISGAACRLSDLGVILVNRQESPARRNFDLAHELFHTLTWESMPPEHRETNGSGVRPRTKRVEQLADNFAAALLMPTASLNEMIDPARQKDLAHLAEVAARLRVSASALGWRLRAMGRIDEPTREKLARVLPAEPAGDTPALFAKSFVGQLHSALAKGRLSTRKAAKTLSMSLHELAQLFETYKLPDPAEA